MSGVCLKDSFSTLKVFSPSLIKVGGEGGCGFVKGRNLIEDMERYSVQIYPHVKITHLVCKSPLHM